MRKKPDLAAFKQTAKDPTIFLEGGAADVADRKPVTKDEPANLEPLKPEPTVQKLFRLRWETSNALKQGAVTESLAKGRRVTETEIVESLIRGYFKLDS
jgi:hypothetical protein